MGHWLVFLPFVILICGCISQGPAGGGPITADTSSPTAALNEGSPTDVLFSGYGELVSDSTFQEAEKYGGVWCGVTKKVGCNGKEAVRVNCIGDALWTPYTNNSLTGPVGFNPFQSNHNNLVVFSLASDSKSPGIVVNLRGIPFGKEKIGSIGKFIGELSPDKEGGFRSMDVKEYLWLAPVVMTGAIREETRCKGARRESTALLFEVKERGRVNNFVVGENSPIYPELKKRIGETVDVAGYYYDRKIDEYLQRELATTCFLGENGVTALDFC